MLQIFWFYTGFESFTKSGIDQADIVFHIHSCGRWEERIDVLHDDGVEEVFMFEVEKAGSESDVL